MNRTLFSLATIFCAIGLVFGAQTANADLMTMDSADFLWKYEMDADPITQDLDSNPGDDWKLLRGTYQLNGDGTMTMQGTGDPASIIAGGSGDPQYISGGVWNNITNGSGFTIEMLVKTAGTYAWQGYTGGLYLLAIDDSSENYSALVIVNEKTLWDTTARTVINDAPNNDDFHVFRIAQDADSATYYVWRDGDLIHQGEGLTTTTWNRIQFGEVGGPRGPNVVDYIRITTGAYAPVPEPSTLALLACGLVGLLAYAWRKRK